MTLPFFIYTPQSPDARSHTHMHLQIHNIILLLVGGIASSSTVWHRRCDAIIFLGSHNFDVFYRVYGRRSEKILAPNCAILWILIFFSSATCVSRKVVRSDGMDDHRYATVAVCENDSIDVHINFVFPQAICLSLRSSSIEPFAWPQLI